MKYIIIILIFSLYSCKEQESIKTTATIKTNQVEQESIPKDGVIIDYPSVPEELMKNLYENCEYMDYIFNDLNFSISQDNRNSIRASIGFVSTERQTIIPSGCKAIGRKFFHVNGEIIAEADVYYSDNCTFYIFFENSKPVYANKMTQAGLNFYGNIIKSGNEQEKKILSKMK